MEIPRRSCDDKKRAAFAYYHSKVDTSRPFSSVKEAVAIFGERFLAGEIYSPKPYVSSPKHYETWKYSFPSTPTKTDDSDNNNNNSNNNNDDNNILTDAVKKLEAELEETKRELKLLKERESETEVAVASLNAELHKNMSKLAKAEAAAAAVKSANLSAKMDESQQPTLAQVMNSVDEAYDDYYLGGEEQRKKKKKKKNMVKVKPIIPLVGDWLSSLRRKWSRAHLDKSLHSTPKAYFG